MRNNITTKNVITITVGVVGAILIYKVLRLTGLIKSESETLIQNKLVEPGSYWRPEYYKKMGAGAKITTKATAEKLADIIHSSMGYIMEDFDKIFGVFSQLKAKTQISFLADIFYQKYKVDLLSYISDGRAFIASGLSVEHMKRIFDYTDKLPAK